MIIFHADLDNTLIFSYKHDIGPSKINVELYEGREISFITPRTYALLQGFTRHSLLVPTTTRTIEQYKRINLGLENLPYALVCNGGILLVDGKVDEDWYQESLDLIEDSQKEIHKAQELLHGEARRIFELRYIEKLFLFTKCEEPEQVVQELRGQLDTRLVKVFNNGSKVYVLPHGLSKGRAVERLRQKLQPEYVLAAGDSEFDISMVEAADTGFLPEAMGAFCHNGRHIQRLNPDEIFSEAVLEACLKELGRIGK